MSDITENLVDALNEFHEAHTLELLARVLLEEYDPTEIEELLAFLTKEN